VLELARATRATFAAHVKYQRLRKKELEIIQEMAGDDFEEAEELLQEAELQAGHIKSSLQNGVVFDRDHIDRCTDSDSSDGRGSSLRHCRLVSPSPSADTSSDL
jgi:ATP-dependent protease HslVU (ClpYQ) ATPase subunit